MLSFCSIRWMLDSLGLQDLCLTNNPAETSNAVFKNYLRLTGGSNEDLNKKKTYQVLLASKNYLEAEWYNSDLANYCQGEYEIKESFKYLIQLGITKKRHYKIPTSKDIIDQINANRKGTATKTISCFNSCY